MSEWAIKWAYRFETVRAEYGFEYVRDSVKTKGDNPIRLYLGRFENGTWAVISAEINPAGEVRGLPVIPGAEINREIGLTSGDAYRLYIDLRDSYGLKPNTPRGGAANKARRMGVKAGVKREDIETITARYTDAIESAPEGFAELADDYLIDY